MNTQATIPQTNPDSQVTNRLLEAMQDRTAPYGTLGHAIRATQSIIHQLETHTQIVQITGHLRLMPANEIDELTILAQPSPVKDLAQQSFNEPHRNQLHTWLTTNRPKSFKNLTLMDDATSFTFKKYTVHIATVYQRNAFHVAQIALTGPTPFAKWFSASKAHKNGAMPWGYCINQNLQLMRDTTVIKGLKSERDVFHAINYNYIDLKTRQEGNPETWEQYIQTH